MYTVLREKKIVKPGGVLEIRSPALPEGAHVEVIVILEPSAKRDDLGWPEDFFATFAGSLPDFPDREGEVAYETRVELP